ncbi:MAG: phage portal protein [Methylacidiphilales bacterium]|nr:phage portal protein [Candidatus Methylacidiphilales bacterium]
MFDRLRNIFRPTETKSLATYSPELLALFGGWPTAAGVSVSPETALRCPPVACAVRVISEAVACLPVNVYQVAADGSRSPVPDHPAQRLLSGEWNEWTGAYDGFLSATVDALVNDYGALVWANKVNGETRELIRFKPGSFTVVRDAATDEPVFKITDANGGQRELAAEDCVSVRAFGAVGAAPLTLCREAVALALVLEQHGARLFQNAAKPAGILKVPGRLSAEALTRLKAAWSGSHGGAVNTGKTAILEDSVTFEPLSLTSTDAQYIELRKFQVLEIARAFRVPPHMLFELDRATWSNISDLGREFLVYCLQPMLRAWESALRRTLLMPEERRAGLVIEFDEDDLTQASIADRAVAYSSLVSARILSPNEARKWERLPPYPDGDRFENPAITPGTPADAPEPAAAPKKRARSKTDVAQ